MTKFLITSALPYINGAKHLGNLVGYEKGENIVPVFLDANTLVTEHLERCFDAFGPQRCYWGTDLTNAFAKSTYRQRITHFTQELKFLSEEDKEWVMGRAILTRLGWK